MREHATSVHLMLDPDDAGQLDVGARRHPTHPDTFFVTIDSLRCHLTLSGPPEPLLAVVERLRAELAATLAATAPPHQPSTTEPSHQQPRPGRRRDPHRGPAAFAGVGSGGGLPPPAAATAGRKAGGAAGRDSWRQVRMSGTRRAQLPTAQPFVLDGCPVPLRSGHGRGGGGTRPARASSLASPAALPVRPGPRLWLGA